MTDQPASPARAAGLNGLQKLTLVLAALVSVAGAGLWAYAAATAPARPAHTQSPTDGPGFQPDTFLADPGADNDAPPTADGEDERSTLELYSPTIFRLGFAFFLGFAIAYTIRTAFKVLLLVVGSIALVLIALQTVGWITVNWDAMRGGYDSAAGWLGGQFESLTAFLRGYIPSGGSAVAGFGVGMLKNK